MKPNYLCCISCLCVILLLSLTASGQVSQNVITGSVKDSLGRNLEGVSVKTKSIENFETKTDENGRFVLEVNENSMLVFSYVGFETKEVKISPDQNNLV